MSRPPCWGIGLGRTGTNSFCQALRALGYERVAHNPPFEMLRSLEGGADNGVALFYKYLDYKFPGSKFVLLLRSLESWLASAARVSERFPIKSNDNDLAIMRRMLIYETVQFDRDKFVSAHHRHYADVRRYFADRPGDLLEMNIVEQGEGWERICPFLSLPIPEAPFPHLHASEGADERRIMFAKL